MAQGWLRVAYIVVLAGYAAYFAVSSIHWPLVNDPAQLQYACFLMAHGMAPYRDLIEMNMPGIYLVNLAVLHTMGASFLAWRIFDFALIASAAAAMVYIALPLDWLAGMLAATLLFLYHGRDGQGNAGQRDLIIATLLLIAFALMFYAARNRKAWPMALFGLVTMFAATIKPVPLPAMVVVFVFAVVHLRARGVSAWRVVLYGVAGSLVPIAAVILFLAHWHAMAAFYQVLRVDLPYYARIGRIGPKRLVMLLENPSARMLGLIALPVLWKLRKHTSWEHAMVLAGIMTGLICYWTQGRGFNYHRYTLMGFFYVWVSMEFFRAIRMKSKVFRVLGIVGLAASLVICVQYIDKASGRIWKTGYINGMDEDLAKLGGAKLSGHVQCIATSADCSTGLYRMKLVQSTGLFYDFYLFGIRPDASGVPAILVNREKFVRQWDANPPEVVVVDSTLYPDIRPDFGKLNNWPEFRDMLDANYTLYSDRRFGYGEAGPMRYRIYVRKGAAQL
jgi:hypothetical protein